MTEFFELQKKQRPKDCFHIGRVKFQLFDANGNLKNDKYTSSKSD